MSDVLPLVGDLDEVDLLREVERAFAVKLNPRDLEVCLTVGDLHGLLLASVPNAERSQTGCLAAKVFFKLKRAIEKQQPHRVIWPETDLVSVTGRHVFRWRRRCERETGLKMPVATLGGLLFWQGQFPERLSTVGDLARAVAALNVAALASPDQPLRTREIWTALVEVIRDNLVWSGAVQPTTRFFKPK
jgi:hypothetical protein